MILGRQCSKKCKKKKKDVAKNLIRALIITGAVILRNGLASGKRGSTHICQKKKLVSGFHSWQRTQHGSVRAGN